MFRMKGQATVLLKDPNAYADPWADPKSRSGVRFIIYLIGVLNFGFLLCHSSRNSEKP